MYAHRIVAVAGAVEEFPTSQRFDRGRNDQSACRPDGVN